jgi:hypothetical protein
MERSNFEKLRVYGLSEKLADELWKIVTPWGYFERDKRGLLTAAQTTNLKP